MALITNETLINKIKLINNKIISNPSENYNITDIYETSEIERNDQITFQSETQEIIITKYNYIFILSNEDINKTSLVVVVNIFTGEKYEFPFNGSVYCYKIDENIIEIHQSENNTTALKRSIHVMIITNPITVISSEPRVYERPSNVRKQRNNYIAVLYNDGVYEKIVFDGINNEYTTIKTDVLDNKPFYLLSDLKTLLVLEGPKVPLRNFTITYYFFLDMLISIANDNIVHIDTKDGKFEAGMLDSDVNFCFNINKVFYILTISNKIYKIENNSLIRTHSLEINVRHESSVFIRNFYDYYPIINEKENGCDIYLFNGSTLKQITHVTDKNILVYANNIGIIIISPTTKNINIKFHKLVKYID
jgi:hypothetical protein